MAAHKHKRRCFCCGRAVSFFHRSRYGVVCPSCLDAMVEIVVKLSKPKQEAA